LQGAGRLLWPLCAGILRLVVAIGAGWIALRLTRAIHWLFAALALALVLSTASRTLAGAVAAGV
jgi:hypothetical protein